MIVAELDINLWTGRMPIPQENLIFVEQASCLFLKMVQDVSCFLLRTLDPATPSSNMKIFQLNVCEFTIPTLGVASHFYNNSREIHGYPFEGEYALLLRNSTSGWWQLSIAICSIAHNGASTELRYFIRPWLTRLLSSANSSQEIKIFEASSCSLAQYDCVWHRFGIIYFDRSECERPRSL